jgi:hypothetical protein
MARGGSLCYGRPLSCGCLQRDAVIEAGTSHGMYLSPEYTAFMNAKQRCTNPHFHQWEDYGGRGIKFLFESFEQFFADLGVKPDGLTLDRINNDGHYEPGNVRWATYHEQATNKRTSRKKCA